MRLERNTKLQVNHVLPVFVVPLLKIKLVIQKCVIYLHAQMRFQKKELVVVMNVQMRINVIKYVQKNINLYVPQMVKLSQISVNLKLLSVEVDNWKRCTTVNVAPMVRYRFRLAKVDFRSSDRTLI